MIVGSGMMTAIRIITIAIGMAICDFIMNYSNAHPWASPLVQAGCQPRLGPVANLEDVSKYFSNSLIQLHGDLLFDLHAAIQSTC